MDNKGQRRLQSFRRLQGWEVAQADFLNAAPAPVFVHFKALDGVITGIEANAVTQDVQRRLSTRKSTDATLRRAAVRDAMRPIAQVARALRGTVFGISTITTMPDTKADNERLVTAANSMVENASIFKTTLIEHGLQPDCIETLQTAAAALRTSIDARGKAKSAGVGATKALHMGLLEGTKLVSLIDAALMPLLKGDHAKLASWRNAKRVTAKGVVGVVIAPPAPAGVQAA